MIRFTVHHSECANPESLVREGPVFFKVEMGREDPYTNISGPSVLFYNFCLLRHTFIWRFLYFIYLFIIVAFCPILVSEEVAI